MKSGPKLFVHRRTHCQFGHSMADAIETVERGVFHRRCRTCRDNRNKRWKAENPDKIKDQQISYRPVASERRWRFTMWEIARLSQEDKEALKSVMLRRPHITNFSELECPIFIVELHGKKHFEYLNEPLPTWDKPNKKEELEVSSKLPHLCFP